MRSPRRSSCCALTTGAADSWRLPFRVIGAIGVVWVVAWLAIVRSKDLDLDKSALPELAPEGGTAARGRHE